MPRLPNDNQKPPRKTESITLRAEKNIMNKFRNEAEQRMESLNTLANQVLMSYVTWYIPAAKGGNYNVPKTLLTDMFEA